MKTIDVWADSLEERACNGRTCGTMLTWGRVVKTGARMCFTGTIAALERQSTRAQGMLGARDTLAVPFDLNHWATCPNAKDFKRQPKK